SLLEDESFKVFGPNQSFFSLKRESTSAATVVLPVHLETELAGILVFENESDLTAFSGLESDLLHRFQNHAVTALGKARLMQDLLATAQNLKETQKQLLDSAHMAGMAEIAISILHNLGNALNSLNVSTSLIQERLGNQRMLPLLEQVALLMEHNQENLGEFLTETAQGKKILPALKELARGLSEWREKLSHEFENLGSHLHHVMEVVRSQEDYINVRGFSEELEIKSLVDEALSIASPFLKKHQVDVSFHHPKEAVPFHSQRSKILQILVNLIKNACEAMIDSPERNLSITIEKNLQEIGIILKDTGPGIPQNLREQIFQFGFTTKKSGHGYGLHYCALAAAELEGDLNLIDSRSGAVFKLSLPLAPAPKKD
ncbi:MAG: GHKL domain-containing protein, partial [Acidobacteria bacterium]|nr:GHKL domain-containing protein [Acidobacteriota bacterium]